MLRMGHLHVHLHAEGQRPRHRHALDQGFRLAPGRVASAAALGAVFVYLAVLEGIVRGLRPAIGRFLLSDSIAAVVIGSEMRLADGSVVTLARAAVVVAAYTLGLWAIATVSFRMRDVQ